MILTRSDPRFFGSLAEHAVGNMQGYENEPSSYTLDAFLLKLFYRYELDNSDSPQDVDAVVDSVFRPGQP
jgi:hypothetical protein